jgi:PAS domain S-box-containing protein
MSASLMPANPKVNVLVVDDRPDKLLAIESILSDLGPNVLKAHSGPEALRHLLRNDFAVILLDVHMPQMDGFETASLIRQRQRSANTPIIFLTAVSDTETHASRGYSLGAVDYIQMPIAPEVLKAKVAVFVELFLKNEQVRQQAEAQRAVQEMEHARRLAEAADRLDFETRRNRFFTLAVDMLGIAGFDGYFRQLNPAWERALGFPEKELLQAPIGHFVHPEDRELTDSQFRRLAEGASTARFENRHLHRDGTYRWLSWTASSFQGEGLAYVFVRDVTEQKAAEEARLQLVREQEARLVAQRENESKDQFLATLSHELRAPLMPILTWTSMLRSGSLDDAGHARAFEVIDRNARLQAQLIADLLDVSRIVSGKLRVDLQSMDLCTVVERGLEAVRSVAAAKAIRLVESIPETPVHVLGDPERLQQVVWNLAANAVKFTPEGGLVQVRLENDGAQACLSVADTGVGIPADFLPQVFERFRQAETGSARAHGGLGLGLTIVRHLVEAHGGNVRAASAGVGRGARFEVRLPAREEGPRLERPADVGEARAAADLSGLLEGSSLLVVDDDPEILEVLRVLFEQSGARVTAVESADDAFRRLDQERPDAIVCDIGMPDVSGYSFLEALRLRPSGTGGDVPALALTAYASPEDAARAYAAGFQAHLAKPVEPLRVLQTVAGLTRRPRPDSSYR